MFDLTLETFEFLLDALLIFSIDSLQFGQFLVFSNQLQSSSK